MSVQPILLEFRDVSKSYHAANSVDATVLTNIFLTITPGQTLAVTGPSGSGKSTLLNIMGTLDQPSSGQVFLHGQDMSGMTQNDLARVRNQDIGFIFQQHYLLPQCTVLENVLLPVLPFSNHHDLDKARHRAELLLNRVGLGKYMYTSPVTLSGGESQRVAVVRALINSPSLVLADEPTGSLDQNNSNNLVELLLELNKEENAALVMVTHSREQADKMSTVYQLSNGQLVSGS